MSVAQPKPFQAVVPSCSEFICDENRCVLTNRNSKSSQICPGSSSSSTSQSSCNDEEVRKILLFKDTPQSESSEKGSTTSTSLRCHNPQLNEDSSALTAAESPIPDVFGCSLTNLSPPQYSFCFSAISK